MIKSGSLPLASEFFESLASKVGFWTLPLVIAYDKKYSLDRTNFAENFLLLWRPFLGHAI